MTEGQQECQHENLMYGQLGGQCVTCGAFVRDLLAAERERAERVTKGITALHFRSEDDYGRITMVCDEDGQAWPCGTIKALRSALSRTGEHASEQAALQPPGSHEQASVKFPTTLTPGIDDLIRSRGEHKEGAQS